jgi:predicted MPP superfamily phosphohydrolase
MAPRRPLQGVVDFTGHFDRLPGWAIVLAWLLASALVALAWESVVLGLVFGLFALADGATLVLLPRLGRSFGPPQLPLLSLTALRLALALPVWPLPIAALFQLGVLLASLYACWVEPARLGLTEFILRSPRLNGCPPLRLLHISDLHIERVTARERRLLRWVQQLAPDVIVITGDYLNISFTHDETAQRQTRQWLSSLRAPGGVYAITGSPPVDPPQVVARLLEGLDLTWLRDEVTELAWHGRRVRIAGLECGFDAQEDERRLRRLLNGRAADDFTLLLYHTPDIMPAAVEAGVDLYLAGHTHGGQLRLPFFGAMVTASIYGKRYEMGAYRQGDTLLYVSRGVGMEGKGAPRARFLCPPEVVLCTLLGEERD